MNPHKQQILSLLGKVLITLQNQVCILSSWVLPLLYLLTVRAPSSSWKIMSHPLNFKQLENVISTQLPSALWSLIQTHCTLSLPRHCLFCECSLLPCLSGCSPTMEPLHSSSHPAVRQGFPYSSVRTLESRTNCISSLLDRRLSIYTATTHLCQTHAAFCPVLNLLDL